MRFFLANLFEGNKISHGLSDVLRFADFSLDLLLYLHQFSSEKPLLVKKR